MSYEEGLETVFSIETNRKIMNKHITALAKEMNLDPMDLLYEVAYLLREEKMKLKDIVELVKSGKIHKNHKNFNKIIQRIEETDKYLDKPFETTEGAEKCRKCGSQRTISYTKQTRLGMDEGLSVIVFCVECKYRYIMNS
jgi:DNA-directed RNA polymerase subunit M/transcription elongation factor TFIIS